MLSVAAATAKTAVSHFGFQAEAHKNAPYGLPVVEDLRGLQHGDGGFFAGLSDETMKALNDVAHASAYPEGTVVMMEGQTPRGVWIVCQGRVKLTTTNRDGKTLIVKIAHPGELLGLQAVVTGNPYELSVETLQASQLAFIGREQFLSLMRKHGDACLRATFHLSHDCEAAYDTIRSIGLCHSVPGKLARLLLQWSAAEGRMSGGVVRLKLGLTHEELAQLIGSSRETVTRILGDFKRSGVVELHGATMMIRDLTALESLSVS
jgi:CRP/FNR family transcriptional regulator